MPRKAKSWCGRADPSRSDRTPRRPAKTNFEPRPEAHWRRGSSSTYGRLEGPARPARTTGSGDQPLSRPEPEPGTAGRRRRSADVRKLVERADSPSAGHRGRWSTGRRRYGSVAPSRQFAAGRSSCVTGTRSSPCCPCRLPTSASSTSMARTSPPKRLSSASRTRTLTRSFESTMRVDSYTPTPPVSR